MGKKKKGQTIMTYDEDMELQKKKYTELALLLDSFKNGFWRNLEALKSRNTP